VERRSAEKQGEIRKGKLLSLKEGSYPVGELIAFVGGEMGKTGERMSRSI